MTALLPLPPLLPVLPSAPASGGIAGQYEALARVVVACAVPARRELPYGV